MYQHLLVPIDGSELSALAEQSSLALAAKLGARITGFLAEPMPPLPHMGTNVNTYTRETDEHLARTEVHAREALKRFADQAGALGVPFQGKFQRTDAVDDAIVAAAAEFGCDLIVMVTHGRGAFGELLFGSHTKNVLSRSKLPVLVLR
jgi:nucleotide-binding universal stress UspA family protein